MNSGVKKKLLTVILILFVLPVFTGVALGYEMSGNRIADIPTVIIDHDNSEFSRILIDHINESDIFNVTYYASSDEEIERRIFEGNAYVGLIIPEGLYGDLQSGGESEVAVIYDGSYMIVAAGAKAAMAEIFQTVKAGILKTAPPFEPAYRILYNPARNYRNFFLPGLIAAIIQVGIVIIGLERAKEGETGFGRDIVKIFETGFVGALSIALNMAVQCFFFDMPFRGSLLAFSALTLQFAVCMASFGYIFGKAIPDKVLATQLACLFVLPAAILGGYTFPLMAMPSFFLKLRMIIPFSYYGEDLRNLTLKELDLTHMTSSMLYFLIVLCVEFIVLYAIAAVKSNRERGFGNA